MKRENTQIENEDSMQAAVEIARSQVRETEYQAQKEQEEAANLEQELRAAEAAAEAKKEAESNAQETKDKISEVTGA